MYEIKFNQRTYDKKNNKFYHDISWDYIKPLWDEDGLEMMIIKNTSVFLKKFSEAADRERKNWANGLVKYDLQDKLKQSENYTRRWNNGKNKHQYHSKSHSYDLCLFHAFPCTYGSDRDYSAVYSSTRAQKQREYHSADRR